MSRRLLSEFAACKAEITLLTRCGESLDAVLRGQVDARQLIFPDGSLDSAEALYQDSPGARAFNDVIAKSIAMAVEALPPDRTLRVLEIGAGTGGTTSAILPHLPADRTEYVFTDVSALFTERAEQKFQAYPFLRYALLDIERDVTEQGFAARQFDIIIAANVLHATSSLRATLAQVAALLAPGGVTVLLEMTAPQRWADLIFGLMDGWWKFADTDLRESYPLLSQTRWIELLGETGFADAVAIPELKDAQQSVLIARGAMAMESRPAQAPGSGSWLVLPDRGGIGERLAALLGSGCMVAATAGSIPQNCRGVINLQPLDADEPASDQLEVCGTALFALQAMVKANLTPSPRLWLVTRDARRAIAQSTLSGFGRVAALEHPEAWGCLVDLDPSMSIDAAAAALFDEVTRPVEDDQIRYRDGQRYAARLVRSRVGAAVPLRFEADATYLITGGLGGLGLLVSQWMVDRGARHLALVGRHSPSDAARAAIVELERAGAHVAVLQADVADLAQMRAALDSIARSCRLCAV